MNAVTVCITVLQAVCVLWESLLLSLLESVMAVQRLRRCECENCVTVIVIVGTAGLSLLLSVHRYTWWYVLYELWPRSMVLIFWPHPHRPQWQPAAVISECFPLGGCCLIYWRWRQWAAWSRVNSKQRETHVLCDDVCFGVSLLHLRSTHRHDTQILNL